MIDGKLAMPVVLENDDGIRIDRTKCMYCGSKVGIPHREDCVAIHKKVIIRATIEYEIEVPFSWGRDAIEFHRNESSWCGDNIIGELEDISEFEGCLCDVVDFEYKVTTEPGPYAKEGTGTQICPTDEEVFRH